MMGFYDCINGETRFTDLHKSDTERIIPGGCNRYPSFASTIAHRRALERQRHAIMAWRSAITARAILVARGLYVKSSRTWGQIERAEKQCCMVIGIAHWRDR